MTSPDVFTCHECFHTTPETAWEEDEDGDAFCPECGAEHYICECMGCGDIDACRLAGPGPDDFCAACLNPDHP